MNLGEFSAPARSLFQLALYLTTFAPLSTNTRTYTYTFVRIDVRGERERENGSGVGSPSLVNVDARALARGAPQNVGICQISRLCIFRRRQIPALRAPRLRFINSSATALALFFFFHFARRASEGDRLFVQSLFLVRARACLMEYLCRGKCRAVAGKEKRNIMRDTEDGMLSSRIILHWQVYFIGFA